MRAGAAIGMVLAAVVNIVLKAPPFDSAVSGLDRPWMYQMQMRLWGVPWWDFSHPLENGWVQIASHHGQAELLPMFLAVGLFRLLHIPLTAVNIQLAYVALDTALLGLVYVLAKRLAGSGRAGVIAAFMYASFPLLAYVTMFPLHTNYTNALLAGIALLWLLYERSHHRGLLWASAALALLLQVSSRLAVIDAVFLLAVWVLFVACACVRRVPGQSLQARIREQMRGPGIVYLLGVGGGIAINVLIGLVAQMKGWSRFGIYQGFLQYYVPNRFPGMDLADSIRSCLSMVGYNGIVLISISLVIAFGYPFFGRAAQRWKFAPTLVWGWFLYYFFPAFIARRESDYCELFFIPMIIMTADVLTRIFDRLGPARRRLFVAALTGCVLLNVEWTLETVRNLQLTRVPFRVAKALGRLRPEHVAWERHPYAFIIGSLNADYHLKAAGYWLRKQASPEHSIVFVNGSVWQKMTAEYYFGTPFLTKSRPARKRLYYLDDRQKLPERLESLDLQRARGRPEAFIQSELLRDPVDQGGTPFPLSGISDFYVVWVHPFERLDESGGWTFWRDDARDRWIQTVLEQRLFKVGEIINQGGKPEVTIYSFLSHPFVRYDERDAQRRFDQEFSRWEDLWGRNYYAQMDSFFHGQ